MRFRKTRQEKRKDYSYQINVQVGADKWVTKVDTIRPGENGVTEVNIKTLYSLEDSEVYYNNKNMRPAKSEEEKAAIKAFKDKFISDFINKYGYEPNSAYVKEEVKERFPTNWNLSIESLQDQGVSLDKSSILADLAYSPYEESNHAVDRLYEVMETMTDKQREVLRLVKLEERTLTESEQILGTSIPNIKKHLDKALEHIRNNY
ncbi:MAG: sigma-70 family RNA polymerase sigma factor [Clostridium sp.]